MSGRTHNLEELRQVQSRAIVRDKVLQSREESRISDRSIDQEIQREVQIAFRSLERVLALLKDSEGPKRGRTRRFSGRVQNALRILKGLGRVRPRYDVSDPDLGGPDFQF